jgi:hypothetical protein
MIAVLLLTRIALAAVDPSDAKGFELLGVQLNIDSYSSVADKLGETKVTHGKSTGAGQDGPNSFCYGGKSGMRLTFLEGFSRAYEQVTGYRLEAHPAKPNKDCKRSGKVVPSIRSANGLGLGISREALEAVLGKAAKSSAHDADYSVQKEVKNGEHGMSYSMDAHASFDKKGRVTSLEIQLGGEPL